MNILSNARKLTVTMAVMSTCINNDSCTHCSIWHKVLWLDSVIWGTACRLWKDWQRWASVNI